MTLGVVDECRRLGIGTKLIDQTISIICNEFNTCQILYLHVVRYNETAIKFYQRNKFATHRIEEDHYTIMEKNYSAIVLYKDISGTPAVSGEDP
jgi:ribosomal protein S18 acetylase RimI-like enzyme